MVQLGTGGVNVSEAAEKLTPGAFQNLLANTTLVLSPVGEQAILQAQAGAPPPPGDVDFPPSAARGKKHRPWWFWVAVLVPVGMGVLLLCCCCGGVWYCCKKRKGKAHALFGEEIAGVDEGRPLHFAAHLNFRSIWLSSFHAFPCFGVCFVFEIVCRSPSNTL
jgi:hypothetical protein